MTKRKKWLFFVLYIIGLSVIAEIAVRVLLPAPSRIPDPVYNHIWNPGTTLTIDSCKLSVNKLSFLRGNELSPLKEQNTYRVFYVGDSFISGNCDAAVPQILESKLRPTAEQSGISLEVINAGTPSYSPILYHLVISNKILPLHPDLVVINVDLTDVQDDRICREIATRDSSGEIVAVPRGTEFASRFERTSYGLVERSRLDRVFYTLRRNSRLYQGLEQVISNLEGKQSNNLADVETTTVSKYPWCGHAWDDDLSQSVNLLLGQLRQTFELLRKHNVRAALVSVPHREHFTGECSVRTVEVLKELAEELKVPFLDSVERLREHFTPDLDRYYLKGDMHLNSDGYRAWARIHEEFLLDPKSHLLPDMK